jgi:hypothetical protein
MAVVDADVISGDAGNALDEQRRTGMVKDNDVAALDFAVRKEGAGERVRRGENLLVDEQEIADEEGALHAFRWDEVGLEKEGEQKEPDNECAK